MADTIGKLFDWRYHLRPKFYLHQPIIAIYYLCNLVVNQQIASINVFLSWDRYLTCIKLIFPFIRCYYVIVKVSISNCIKKT